MNRASRVLDTYAVPALTALSENTYLSAIRAGMVAVVPLTIIGGLFMIVAYLPVAGWEKRVEKYLPLLQVPVTATFGVLAVVACFAIAFDLGRRLKQDPLVSAIMATVVRSFNVSRGSAPASSSIRMTTRSLLFAARANGVVPSPSEASPVGV